MTADDERPMPDAVRGDAVHAEQQQCDACGAMPGEPCGPDCLGLAAELDRLEEAAMPDTVPAGEAAGAKLPAVKRSETESTSSAAGCAVCQARGMASRGRCGAVPGVIASDYPDAIIARAMTVEASKLYARLFFRHQLDGLERP